MEPFGDERADLRAGGVSATFANANRGKGKSAFKPSDFALKFGETHQEQTVGEMLATFTEIAATHNAANKKRRESA